MKIEEIFVEYANASLKENPEIFFDIYKSVKELLQPDKDYDEYLSTLIKYFVDFVRIDDPEESRYLVEDAYFDIREKPPIDYPEEEFESPHLQALYSACCAVYRDIIGAGSITLRCNPERCIQYVDSIHSFGYEPLNEPERLKCYECYHLYFKKLLIGLIEDKEYSEIPEPFSSEIS